jgi:hypothetical protein
VGLCGPVVSLSSGAPYESRYVDSDNGMGGTDLGTDCPTTTSDSNSDSELSDSELSDSDSNSDSELSDSDSNSDSELSDSGTRLPTWSVKSSVGN